jgi:opacity protein-like surface antigen
MQSPSNAAGGLFEVRHIKNPILGFEATYAFNRANQVYNPMYLPVACPTNGCSYFPAIVSANAHEVTADWVPSVRLGNLRPFAVLGGGLLLNVPSSGQTNTSTAYKPVYVYGAGVDWELLPHLGLRLQYRGNLYNTPDLTKLYRSSGVFTHTAEPMAGVFFRF